MEIAKSVDDKWYMIENVEDVNSPALLVYPDRIEQNIRKMIEIAGNVNLLRPHVKTHKMAEIIRLQMKHGIHKFKCATIAETEMVAQVRSNRYIIGISTCRPQYCKIFQVKTRVFRCKDILHCRF